MNDSSVSDLRSALSETRASLNKKPETLAIELSGRLLHLIDFNYDIRRLVQQCFQKSTLLPVTVCYPAPGGTLVQSLEHKDLPIVKMEKFLFVTNNGKNLLALSEKNEIIVWDLVSGDVEREILLLHPKYGIKLNVMKRSTDCQRLIMADAFQRNGNPVIIYNINTDDITYISKLGKLYKSVGFVDNFSIDATEEHIIINIKDKESDLFDMKGQHVHHFTHPASSVQLTPSGHTVVLLAKEKAELTLFSLRKLSYWPQPLAISDITHRLLLSVSRNSNKLYIGYKSLPKVDVIVLDEKSESARITNSIDVGSHPDNPGSIIHKIEQSADENYLLISGNMQVLMWDLKANKLHRKFSIPNEARSQYNVQQFKCVLDPSNNTLVMIHDERLIVFK